ncbi:MAG TPA: MFS transporter [Flavobacteriales bacterium]|nr:MFS transporter [Flavobacteriales bacterium]
MRSLKRGYRFYIGSFDGLSREVWVLAFITFVNRAGTMVVPFLSLYLTKDMHLTLEEVGWIMSSFGAGSVVGSWLGGKLADKFGFYDVMVGALLTSGVAFIFLQYVNGFWPFCIGIFVLLLLSDAFRPAMFVAIRAYAGPQSRTRAVTLIRLAINLGFSMGPAVGGLIIAGLGYAGLFWVDGLTCLIAMGMMLYGLPRAQAQKDNDAARSGALRSPYRDGPFLFFLLTTVLICVPFLQYFSTVPLFYSDVFGLDEFNIGLLLGMNGALIFLVEMPLIKYSEDRGSDRSRVLVVSVAFIALSFVMLNLAPHIAFLWIGMLFMTVGEMLNFPFMNRFAYDRAEQGKPGAYMALFTISWSVAHIIGHTLGLNLVDRFGYALTWYIFTGMLVLAMGMLLVLKRMVEGEKATTSASA